MNSITILMINIYRINEIGIDFMGYELQKGDTYTFHHLIVPKQDGGPYARWNGAILCRSSHDYLHLIEKIDYVIFYYITCEMRKINIQGYLTLDNLRCIHNLLEQFEKENPDIRGKSGKRLMKEKYTRRLSSEQLLKKLFD